MAPHLALSGGGSEALPFDLSTDRDDVEDGLADDDPDDFGLEEIDD